LGNESEQISSVHIGIFRRVLLWRLKHELSHHGLINETNNEGCHRQKLQSNDIRGVGGVNGGEDIQQAVRDHAKGYIRAVCFFV